jgi:hypothetical protein
MNTLFLRIKIDGNHSSFYGPLVTLGFARLERRSVQSEIVVVYGL